MNTKLQRFEIPTIVCAVALGMCACGKKNNAPPQRPPVMVTMATAIQTNTPVVIQAYGTVLDCQNVDIVPQVSGILISILFQEGAVVTNGQPLFRIDPRDYRMRVQQAEGMTAVDRSNLDLARATLQRNQPLLEKRLISPDVFDTIKAKVAALEAQLQMDEASLEQAQLNLSRCTILAPIDGICSKRYVDAGNLVSAGLSRLTNIRSYNPLRLECSVSEQYLPAIRNAMAAGPVAVSVTPRGESNSHPGILNFMDNAVNPMSGTILLRGEIPNPSMKLWADQFVDVQIRVDSIPDAVMVPESAVQFGKNGTYLFVVDKDRAAIMKMVKTGIRHNDWIQIAEGVTAGETVISMGQLKLYPGAMVMDPAKMSAGNKGNK